MAASAEPHPGPLLTLLREAADLGRPELRLTRRRLAEVLGVDPGDGWLRTRTETWRGAGFALEVDAEHGWVLFAPLTPAERLDPVDVRVVVDWLDPADAAGPGIVRARVAGRLLLGATDDVAGCAADARFAGADELVVATTATVGFWGDDGEVDLDGDEPDVRALALLAARLQAAHRGRTVGGGGSGI